MSNIKITKIATLQGHKDAIYCICEGSTMRHIVTASSDGMVVEWNLENPKDGHLIAKIEHSVYAIHKTADEKLLIAHNFDGIHQLDLGSKEEEKSLHFTKDRIFSIVSTKKYIIVGTSQGNLVFIDRENWKVEKEINVTNENIRSIAVFGEHQLLIAGSDNKLYRYDLVKNQLTSTPVEHLNSILSVTIFNDEVFTTSRDARIKVWDNVSFDLKKEIVAHMYPIYDLVIDPTYTYFATCSMDKTIKIWDLKTKKLLKVIDKIRHEGHTNSINRLYWTSYNGWLVSVSDDRYIKVWQIDNHS